ncbi:MAG TPA: prephenate dehydrogenase/arogenate dehydrogenase family protein [Vicinamibacterales bacterium]|nr:prephenate dehydrogenase/arogenate dehydrogenase family protein [Vicinamibacterales bacterium]
MRSADVETIAVIGHGLIGGSIALAVRERLPEVAVLTLDRGDDLGAAAASDLVILAAPISANIQILQRLRPLVTPRTLITDTGSTKAAVVAAAAGLRFVGGHPLAGAAASGREAARGDLFEARRWILTPTPATPPDDVDRLMRFAERLGASALVMDADHHDRIFAFLSHLPQLVVSALMDVAAHGAGDTALPLAGPGLRDSTRLAGSPADIWRDIVATNETNVRRALDAMIQALTRLRDDGDGAVLERTFDHARRARRALDDTVP